MRLIEIDNEMTPLKENQPCFSYIHRLFNIHDAVFPEDEAAIHLSDG